MIGFVRKRGLMKLPERIARWHLRSQISDPALREGLEPGYVLGCKRILVGRLVPALIAAQRGAAHREPRGGRGEHERDRRGEEHEVDAIIFGTGFTHDNGGRLVRGPDGRTLDDVWQGSPRAHLGATSPASRTCSSCAGPTPGSGTPRWST